MDFRLKFREIVKSKRNSIKESSKFYYEEEIANLLSQNFNETINFLSSATNVEIGCAIDGLVCLVKRLDRQQSKTIIEIFKQKKKQFPNIDLFTSRDYDKEIALAENYVR